ncbi:MAG TPA: energy transducer TonB [Xanthomonadaceae bacterium]|nr:energy transducer TonB [Xanthomonadaceae bacterium]
MSRKIVLSGAVLLALSCGVASAQQAEHANFTCEASLSIGADKKIAALTFVNRKATNDLVCKRLETVVRSWTFEPGSVNGQPMATETTLHVELEASKSADGGYAIKLLDAFTGPSILRVFPPDYPRQEMMVGAEAKVTLLLSIDATGAPIDISVASVITNGSSASKANFAQPTIDAAKHWRFQPETVGGHPVASHVHVPTTFCLDASSQCPSIAKQIAAESGATPANVPVALDSKVKLVTQVAGTTF